MKQVIVVRKDLDMSAGEIVVQVADAVLKSFKLHLKNQGKSNIHKECIDYNENLDLVKWHTTGETKTVVWCKNMNEFENVRINAVNTGINVAVIIDNSCTKLDKNTITCMALGPDKNEIIDTVISKLKLIK